MSETQEQNLSLLGLGAGKGWRRICAQWKQMLSPDPSCHTHMIWWSDVDSASSQLKCGRARQTTSLRPRTDKGTFRIQTRSCLSRFPIHSLILQFRSPSFLLTQDSCCIRILVNDAAISQKVGDDPNFKKNALAVRSRSQTVLGFSWSSKLFEWRLTAGALRARSRSHSRN